MSETCLVIRTVNPNEGPVIIYAEEVRGIHGVGQGRSLSGSWTGPFFLEKRGGPKENFKMIGGGSLCVKNHILQFT